MAIKANTASWTGILEEQGLSGQQISVKRNQLISGVYFYRITQGNEVLATGKIIVE